MGLPPHKTNGRSTVSPSGLLSSKKVLNLFLVMFHSDGFKLRSAGADLRLDIDGLDVYPEKET